MRGTTVTTDLQRRLAEETEASEAGRDLDAVYTRNTQPAKEPSQVYSLRLPVERIEEIRSLAAQNFTQPTSLIRRWVLERLDDELVRREGDVATRRDVAASDDLIVMTRPEFVEEIRKVVHAVLVQVDEETGSHPTSTV